MEIYDWDTLTPGELIRQKNIIRNFKFMKKCGEFVENILLYLTMKEDLNVPR